ncbi:MAG: sialidase family protein [Dehalococcoidales bacterium]|nr:sialidase family protein [Dehalococcoidales bacterium]
MKTKLISKILGVGLALGMVFSLGAAFIATPVAQADEMEWGAVNTPSWDDLVILPSSDILDYAVGGDEGDIIYAVLELTSECTEVGHFFEYDDDGDPLEEWGNFALVKSDDGGVTWSDITDNVIDASSLPSLIVNPDNNYLPVLTLVAVAPDDDDWLAVAGYYFDPDASDYVPFVVASEDGGDNFTYAHPVGDAAIGSALAVMMDMAVSPAVGSIHNIALAGIANDDDTSYPDATMTDLGTGVVFRLEAGTWLTGGWVDTRFYPGWNDSTDDIVDWAFATESVVAVDFSPNFDMDDTIVCMSVGDYTGATNVDNMPFIQEGTLNGDGAWNAEAGFGDATLITDEGADIRTISARYMMGFALPADFDGAEPADNNIYFYVNAIDFTAMDPVAKGYVMISEDGALTGRCGPSGDPVLASIDVHGDADTCKAMVGTLGVDFDVSLGPDPEDWISEIEPCAGVAVYHTVELDDCCPEWEVACKDPSGPTLAVVCYTPDGEKAFATTSGSRSFLWGTEGELTFGLGWGSDIYFMDIYFDVGNPLDESAFSVSLDDAVSFNQIGLIDTDIDFLSDLAVCPDCSVLYLSTINVAIEYDLDYEILNGGYPCGDEEWDCCDPDENRGWFACDSVWRSYDSGDTWERVYHGNWSDDPSGWDITNPPDFGNLVEDDNGQIDHRLQARQLLLRLPCDEDTECCTIYMGIQDTQDLFYSRDCGQCWNKSVNQKLVIQDFAVETENVVYILDENGQVSTSTQYGRRPSDGVDTGLDYGHSIVSCCAAGWVVVGGAGDEPVAWSEDGGETWDVTDDLPGDGDTQVHVACDPVCENIIYAAIDGKGIYRTDINDGSWDDMNAMEYDYTGIVVAREGTLYASSDQIWADTDVFCEGNRYANAPVGEEPDPSGYEQYSGVARNLTPCETDCCGTEDWDYLIAGLSPREGDGCYDEDFDQNPSALRICGCLSPDTNSVLWAIDTWFYDVMGETCGLLWSYEDCAAKHGPTLTSPEDGAVLACDVCESCEGAPITLKWERMCLACSYDIEIMDEDGNTIIEITDEEITGDPPTFYLDGISAVAQPNGYHYGALECGRTYTWHVREANTETDECVHSPWSETWSFTIEASSANAVQLIAPEQGDVIAQRTGVGFSWSSVYDATTYSFVLSASPDLSGALASADVTGTAYSYSGTLDYETTYYWQVTAWKDGTMMSQSDVGTFAIAAEEIVPEPVQPTPPPVVNIPPVQQVTPTWMYVVIAIGIALIVVVIVLIVRGRKSS